MSFISFPILGTGRKWGREHIKQTGQQNKTSSVIQECTKEMLVDQSLKVSASDGWRKQGNRIERGKESMG